MRERSERVESPGTYVTMIFAWPFLLRNVFFRMALLCSGSYQLERCGMPLHDAVGINCKMAQLLKIKAQLPSILGKGCMLMIVCVFAGSIMCAVQDQV